MYRSDNNDAMTLRTFLGSMKPPQRRAFAAAAGLADGYLQQLRYTEKRPGARAARRISEASGGAVALHSLRPDLWPDPAKAGGAGGLAERIHASVPMSKTVKRNKTFLRDGLVRERT